MPEKVYDRILVEVVIEQKVGEEQSSFRKGRTCAHHIVVLMQICERLDGMK